jgi:hypothetical protein
MINYKIMNKALTIAGVKPHNRENFINYIRNPYSPWENSKKVIFIHVPKVAGKSLSYSLLGAPNGTGHQKLRYYERDMDKFNSYFKATFVRNPWDRLVSAFHYMKSHPVGSNDRDFFDTYIGQDLKFSEFVFKLEDDDFRKLCVKWEHFTPQSDFIVTSSGELKMDFVGRFESIDLDYSKLATLLKVQNTLAVKNTGVRNSYISYYDSNPRLVDIVGNVYEKDCKLLDYKYGEVSFL